MKINKAINLVIEVETDSGSIYVHSTPLGREVFERYYKLLSLVFTGLYEQGAAYVISSGSRVAALELKARATAGFKDESDRKEALEDIENGLLAEVRRISNVVTMSPDRKGWETVPLQEAIARKMLSDDDVSEVENAIVFFIVICSMQKKGSLIRTLNAVSEVWGVQTVSSNSTEFARSLPTSTAPASSGETVVESSHPS